MGFFSKKQLFRDLILILACLLIAGGVALALRLTRTEGAFVVLTVTEDGETREIGRYPLDTDTEIPLHFSGSAHNTLIIRSGTVHMEDADCPDRLCVKQGTIRYTGQTIVCLPHGLVVRIVGNGADGVDLSATGRFSGGDCHE